MKTIDFQISRREHDHHRGGHAILLIEGLDAEITVDPGQFMQAGIRHALAQQGITQDVQSLSIPELFALQAPTSFDPVKYAADVDAYCQARADKAIQRRIDRLRNGLVGSPVNMGKFATTGISAGTADQMAGRKRVSEAEAVERYLNRGKLAGLDKDARKKRMARKANEHDCYAEWCENRKKLIERRAADLKEWEEKLAAGNPKAERMVRLLKAELDALSSPVLAASHGFQYAYTQYMTEGLQLATDDIRIWPLMTNTTLDTVRDAVDQFSDVTADEFDGANYSSGGLALDSQAVAVDDSNDRAEFDAADEVVSALGAGTRSIQGVAVGLFNTNTAGSLPIHWIEFAANKTPDGSDFTFAFNAEGIIQMADG